MESERPELTERQLRSRLEYKLNSLIVPLEYPLDKNKKSLPFVADKQLVEQWRQQRGDLPVNMARLSMYQAPALQVYCEEIRRFGKDTLTIMEHIGMQVTSFYKSTYDDTIMVLHLVQIKPGQAMEGQRVIKRPQGSQAYQWIPERADLVVLNTLLDTKTPVK